MRGAPPAGEPPVRFPGPDARFARAVGVGATALAGVLAAVLAVGFATGAVSPTVRVVCAAPGRTGSARIELAELVRAVELWRSRHGGALPATLDDLVRPDGTGELAGATVVPRDPWDNPYRFEPRDDGGFTLTSLGADGVERGADSEDLDLTVSGGPAAGGGR